MPFLRAPFVRPAFFTPLLVAALAAGCADSSVETGESPDDTQAAATSAPLDSALVDRVGGADLVFVGEVVRVAHRLSDVAGPDTMAAPHTFVTYAVEEVLLGRAGDEVTLRFAGGPTGDGRFARVSGVPRFTPGDRDLLLVQDNERSACPLVGCGQGRYRLLDDRVYTEGGRELRVAADGRLVAGARAERPELDVAVVGGVVYERVGEDSAAEAGTSAVVAGDQLTLDGLSGRLTAAIAAAFGPSDPTAGPVFRNADIARTFTIPRP